MDRRNYLENSRWGWAYLVECETCNWYNLSQDYEYTRNSARVHKTILTLGHSVRQVEEIHHE